MKYLSAKTGKNLPAKEDETAKTESILPTLQEIYNRILLSQGIPKDFSEKSDISVELKMSKPVGQTSLEDYRREFDIAVLQKAGYNLKGEELEMARSLMKFGDNWTLEAKRAEDAKPGAMFEKVRPETIEIAKRVGQAVLQYRELQTLRAEAEKQQAESRTNQMFLDVGRLAGNSVVRWAERTLNTPRDLLRQADKGEIEPFSAMGKRMGLSIAEMITGKQIAEPPTASESFQKMTGIELPEIPEIKLQRPFEYQSEKFKREGAIGEDIGATAIDLFLLRRGIVGKPNTTPQTLGNLNLSKVFRVQGGELPKASKFRMFIGEQGNMVVKGKEKLFVTFDDFNRVKIFQAENRLGKAEVISFEVKTSFVQKVREVAVVEKESRLYPNLPQMADRTKTNNSFGLPVDWIRMMKQSAINGSGRIESLNSPTNYQPLMIVVPTVNLATPNEKKQKL